MGAPIWMHIAHGAPLEAVIARGMKVAPVQIAKAIVAPMQVGAICKGNASVLMQIANAHSLGGWMGGWTTRVAPLVGASPPPPLSLLSSLCQGSNLPGLSKVASVHPLPILGIVMALSAHFNLSLKCIFVFLYFVFFVFFVFAKLVRSGLSASSVPILVMAVISLFI